MRLRQEVGAGAAQIEGMQQDLQAWEEAVTARDAELRNLQVRQPCQSCRLQTKTAFLVHPTW